MHGRTRRQNREYGKKTLHISAYYPKNINGNRWDILHESREMAPPFS